MTDTVADADLALYAAFDERYLGRDERRPLDVLPVVDFAPFRAGSAAGRAAVAREIRQAAIDIGFFHLVGHGIDEAELDEITAQAHRFFALPLGDKMTCHSGNSLARQGYMRTGGANPDANPDKDADLKERFSMSRELMPGEPAAGSYGAGQSQWPTEPLLPGFADLMRGHIRRRTALARQMVQAFALSLGLPLDHLDAAHACPGCAMILNYYPPLDPAGARWSFSPHTDYGSFTLLSQDMLGGLQVRNAAGRWIDVPPLAGGFVVNVGDLLARWTNDLYASNLHRAANLSGAPRIAVPFFVYPNGRATIDCLPTCREPGNPPRHQPVVAETYMSALIAQSNRTGRPGLTKRTAARLES